MTEKKKANLPPPSLLIRGGHLIDPAARIDAPMDVLLKRRPRRRGGASANKSKAASTRSSTPAD
jgi:hypothetical protein